MPIYEYACRDCGREFEQLVRSDTVAQCPQCHSTTALEKQLSVFATSAAAPAPAPLPGPCGACGHAGGPGACGMAAH